MIFLVYRFVPPKLQRQKLARNEISMKLQKTESMKILKKGSTKKVTPIMNLPVVIRIHTTHLKKTKAAPRKTNMKKTLLMMVVKNKRNNKRSSRKRKVMQAVKKNKLFFNLQKVTTNVMSLIHMRVCQREMKVIGAIIKKMMNTIYKIGLGYPLNNTIAYSNTKELELIGFMICTEIKWEAFWEMIWGSEKLFKLQHS